MPQPVKRAGVAMSGRFSKSVEGGFTARELMNLLEEHVACLHETVQMLNNLVIAIGCRGVQDSDIRETRDDIPF